MRWMAQLWLLIWKDLKIEARGRQFVVSSISFGVLLLLVMGMALDGASKLPIEWAAGLLWMCLFFSTAVSIQRHDHRDREDGALYGALSAPIDRSLVFYAKWSSGTVFLVIVEAALVLAFFVVLNQPAPLLFGWFVCVMIGGAIGLTGVGTFVVTLVSTSSMRDMLVPIMLFPLTIPLFLALIRLTVFTLQPSLSQPSIWIEVLVGYVVAFSVLPWLLYEPLMEV